MSRTKIGGPKDTPRATFESTADTKHSHTSNSRLSNSPVHHIFSLPPELCSQVCSAVLHSNNETLALLQIRGETIPIIQQPPMSFSSQAKLYTWLHRASDSEIKRMKVLTLRLTDVDLTPLFEEDSPTSSSSSSSIRGEPRRNAWSLYQQDLAKLDRAMQALTGLTDLTIVPPQQGTALVRGMYLTALGIVAGRCSGLKCLTVRDDEERVREKVPGLDKLPKVVFEGMEVVKKEARSVVVKVELDEDEW